MRLRFTKHIPPPLRWLLIAATLWAAGTGLVSSSVSATTFRIVKSPEEFREVRRPLVIKRDPQHDYGSLVVALPTKADLNLLLLPAELTNLETRGGASVLISYWHRESWIEGRRNRSTYVSGDLVSVLEMDGRPLLNRSFCSRHQRTMERRPIPIQYGLPEPVFLNFLEKECPHAGVALGGCVVDDSHTSMPAYVCSDCDAIYQIYRDGFGAGVSVSVSVIETVRCHELRAWANLAISPRRPLPTFDCLAL